MARLPVTKFICDRCQKTYQEPPTESASSFEKEPPVLHLEFNPPPAAEGDPRPAREVVSFNDLCPKCRSRVADLVRQINLEKNENEPDSGSSQNKTDKADQSKTDKPLDASPKPAENKTKPTEGKPDAKVNKPQ